MLISLANPNMYRWQERKNIENISELDLFTADILFSLPRNVTCCLLKVYYATFTAKIKVYTYIYILPFPPSVRHCKNMLDVLLQKDFSFVTVYCLQW